ncbi:MAG: alpha/beta fold hydrolase [Blastocatellia bacterium]
MSVPALLYRFGAFQLNPDERLLARDGAPLSLTHKAFETLVLLVQNHGRVMSKDRLMQEIWPDSYVEESNLAQNISILRKTLGDGVGGLKIIETVPKHGYRFILPVQVIESGPPALPPGAPVAFPPMNMTPPRVLVRERTRSEIIIAEEEDDADLGTDMRRGGSSHSSAVIETQARIIPHLAGASTVVRHTLETHYAQSGDVNIAYQVIGDGPIDLVFVMGWVSHLDYFWQEPSFAYFLNRLASFSRLIIFDKRGTGLSDRVPLNQLPTLEQRMDDVRAVLEAVGSSRAVLCGVSEGGPMCALFAATYPEKTTALVMIGTYARRLWAPDYPWGPTAEQREHFFEEIRRHWGGPLGIEDRAPSLAHDERFRQWWATYLRMGASPGAALALTKMNADIDVRGVLPSVRVPTLVLHRSEDTLLRVEEGRYIASLIPGARFVEFPGADHLPFVGDQDAILDEIEQFLTGMRHAPAYDTVLATVMCLDLTQASATDAQTQDLRRRHCDYAAREIELFRGKISDLTPDMIYATFDGPARAIRCAMACNAAAARLGLVARAGVHTGECEMRGDRVSGPTVEITQAVTALAAPGETIVTGTVKSLVPGSGLRFADHGATRLDILDEALALYLVAG